MSYKMSISHIYFFLFMLKKEPHYIMFPDYILILASESFIGILWDTCHISSKIYSSCILLREKAI